MSTESTYTVGEGYVPDVGGHTTGGGIAAAAQAANAAAAQIKEEAAKIETAAKQEIAKETDPNARAQAAGVDGLGLSEADMKAGGVGQNGKPIDLSDDKGMAELNSAMTSRAENIDAVADRMKSPGVNRNVPGVTSTALETTSYKLAGAEGDAETSAKIKAADGNLKGGNSFSALESLGLKQQHAPAPAGPRLAAAPSAPGLGGGSSMMARSRSINTTRSDEKVARINGELSKRDPNTPSDMSRHDYNAQKYQDRQGEDALNGQQNHMAYAKPVAAAIHNPMFSMNLAPAPKGPSGAILSDSSSSGGSADA